MNAARTSKPDSTFVALCGGIGGAKLALGLSKVLPPSRLTIVVNTGDDFEHMGLHVSPDIDTVLYTLAGLSNTELGWGLEGETWNFMGAMERLGGPTWFRLGDRDLATHVLRTERLRAGQTLSEITDHLRSGLGIAPPIVPMSDQPVRTVVETTEGLIPFQTYFVGRRCEPVVRQIRFEGANAARPAPAAAAALADPRLAGIIVCPSNPWLSIDPLLAIPELKAALRARNAPLIAVSPLVGGAAVKGPTAKIMRELGLGLTQQSIAAHYQGLLDGLMVDTIDASEASGLSVATEITGTVMRSLEDRMTLARAAVAFCERLGSAG